MEEDRISINKDDSLYNLMGGFGKWHATYLIGLGSIIPAINTFQILVHTLKFLPLFIPFDIRKKIKRSGKYFVFR